MNSGLRKIFVCSNCDAQFPKWSGRCSECGAWGTLSEEILDDQDLKKKDTAKIKGAQVIDLKKIKEPLLGRLQTKIGELDRVLGGGLVPGSLILLSGEPGIGKSTLLAQLSSALEEKEKVVYLSGEESAFQVKMRFDRLACRLDNLKFISETNVEKIIATILKIKPTVLIVDSIQTVYSSLVPAEAGSISQIRAATVKFLELAKENNIVVILIGHITKDGQVAGPKSLEHIVDTVLYLETEANNNYSLLRSTKNRFGSVNELGVLEMTGKGFVEVKNPSLAFIEADLKNVSGSVLSCVLEGTRSFLADIQALVTKTVFGYPVRKTSGFDLGRLQVLSTVITKRTKISLLNQDIILNIVGGLKISDPALDLAVVAAIISSFLNKSFDRQTLILGEVGLGAELRPVFRLEQRLREAERLGFKRAIIPNSKTKSSKLKLIKIKNLQDLVEIIK